MQRAGFYWNAIHKNWVTATLKTAMRLRQYADKTAENELNRALLKYEPWPHRLTYPHGLTPKPFQLEDALFSLARNRSYLALDPGLGKTIIAALIRWALADCNAAYICPPFLQKTVAYEFDKWCYGIPISIFPDSKITRKEVISELTRLADRRDGSGNVLFIDEAHRFKNESALRTKALFEEIVPSFSRVVFLSGTPMPNRPIELYSILSSCAPETIDFMDRTTFGKRYCAGYFDGYGWDFKGASNMAELGRRVKEKFMRRRKKADVLKELPPKTEELLLLGDNLTPKVAAIERDVLTKFSPEDLMGHLAPNDHLTTYRRELGKLKAPIAVKHIKDHLRNTDENLLIFAIHKEVVAILEHGLKEFKPLVITGKVPTSKRNDLVNLYQSDSTRRLFIGNIDACGVGFTLTKATRVQFVEFAWSPSANDQASDRTHRIGQTDNVLVQYMVFKNSVDRVVLETILRKKQNIKHI